MSEDQDSHPFLKVLGIGCSIPMFIIACIALVVIIGGVAYGVDYFWTRGQTPIQNAQTHATQHSQGYIEAANQQCFSDYSTYEESSETGVRRAMVLDCEQRLVGIPADEVQPTIVTWITSNGGKP